jgi:hypothetical protein
VGAQKVGQRLTVEQHRRIKSVTSRAIARRDAETAISGPQLCGLGIQKVGRERTVSRVLVLRIQLCYFEYRTTSNDAQRHDAAAYYMRTGMQNLLYPSTLSDPAGSASGVGDRRPAISPLAGRSLPVHGGLSATARLRLVPWWRLRAGRARRPCESARFEGSGGAGRPRQRSCRRCRMRSRLESSRRHQA